MAIGIYFHPNSMTAEQYDTAVRKLEGAGQGKPAGRRYHACFGPPDKLMVFDVWDSEESFKAFGERVRALAAEMGVDLGTPEIMPIHNIIQG